VNGAQQRNDAAHVSVREELREARDIAWLF
jgi:hypothetical protein